MFAVLTTRSYHHEYERSRLSAGGRREYGMQEFDLLADINRNIRKLAAERSLANTESEWEFVCECGEDDCTAHVQLALPVYDDVRRTKARVLAPGHPRRVQP